jgi:small subunit ribosomal protein S20
MATRHKSAMKQFRASKRKHEQNVRVRSRVKSLVRKAKEAVVANDTAATQASLSLAVAELQRYADRKVIHKNAASRKISRLMKYCNSVKKAQ